MRKVFAVAAVILMTLGIAAFGGAGTGQDPKPSVTTWTNDQGEGVTGNWSSGEIVEIETVEEYYWHMEHYDPAVHYEVAPWLYDLKNLESESGGDTDMD